MDRNIKERLYIATVCAEHREIITNYGIGVELDQFCQAERMDAPLQEEAGAEIEGLIAEAQRCVLHAPFSEIFPAAIDPMARKFAMKRLQQAAGFAVKYGAEKMVVHSGWVPLIYYKEWQEDRAVEFWEELMKNTAYELKSDGKSNDTETCSGKEIPLRIVVENVMDDEPYMMAKMMERINNTNIRLCLDVGHAVCVSKVPADEWLEVLSPYIGHFHIHNNDGTHDWHKPVFEGIVDMEKFLDKAIGMCAPDTTFTIESLEGLSSMKWLAEREYLG